MQTVVRAYLLFSPEVRAVQMFVVVLLYYSRKDTKRFFNIKILSKILERFLIMEPIKDLVDQANHL